MSALQFSPAPLWLAISAALCTTSTLAADTQHQDTVVVTATRSGQQALDLPLSIGVVGKDQLEMDQGGHIEDSINQVAGATLNQLSGSSSHNTGIRLPLNYDGYYLFLQDGIPLQSSAFFNHNGLRWSSYNTSADQIEILKGAGTTLYGAGAVAATINVRSGEPSFEEAGQATLLAGEDDYYQFRVSQSGAINENQAFFIAASALEDGGWRDHTRRERQEIIAKHLWQLDADNSLKTVLQVSQLDDESATSLSEDLYRSAPTDSGLSDAVLAIDPHRTSDFARLSVEWQHRINDQLSFSSIPYARYSTNDYVATWRSYTPKGETTIRTLGVLNKLDYRHNDSSTTLMGLDLEHSESDNFSFQPFTVTTSGWSSNTYPEGFVYSDKTIQYQNASPWLQHNWLLTDQLSLQLGARYDYHRFELDNKLAETDDDGFGNRQLADRSDRFNSFSPKLAASWQLDEDSTLYGRIARANRLPSASSLYSLKSGDSKSLVGGVDEETSTTYEVGYKLLQDGLSLNLALYQMNIEDAIVSATDSNGDSYRTNAGETRHRGLEIELGYRFSDDWQLQLALSESRHEFIDYVNAGTDFSGNDMKLAPETKGNLALNWTPTAVPGLTSQLQLEYFGSYWMDDANSRRADSYNVVNLKTRYDANEQWSLFARIDNLFDEEYATQQEIRYGKARFYPGKPLTFNAGVQYRW